MARYNQFDINTFVCDWNQSSSFDEMQTRWPISKANLSGRASKLRKRGYDLKNLRDKSTSTAFVEVVNASTSLDEAADRLATTKEHVKVRAAQLRRQGVTVRTFKPNKPVKPQSSLRPGVTEADAMNYVNEYQRRYDLPPIVRGTWYQSIRPMAVDDKAAWQSGATWLYDVMFVQELAEYIAKRRVLIDLGCWQEKRPYGLEDLRNLVEIGVYDGEIEHPVFDPTVAEFAPQP